MTPIEVLKLLMAKKMKHIRIFANQLHKHG